MKRIKKRVGSSLQSAFSRFEQFSSQNFKPSESLPENRPDQRESRAMKFNTSKRPVPWKNTEVEAKIEVPNDLFRKHVSHPVGDRRLDPDAYHQHADEDAPHSLWVSLARLEEDQPVSTESPEESGAKPESARELFQRLETEGTEHAHPSIHTVVPRELTSHPVGERRLGAVQELEQFERPVRKIKRKMIYRQTQGRMQDRGGFHCVLPRELESHPVGDRRAEVEKSHFSFRALWSGLVRRRGRREALGSDTPIPERFCLGLWAYYFIAKLCLFGMTLIGFHPLENLLFAAFIMWQMKSSWLRRLKNGVTAILAFVLLYYDSWLPSMDRVVSQASLLSHFSLEYLFELLGRFISYPVIGTLLVVWLVYWMISKWMNAGILLMIGMVLLSVVQSPIMDMLRQPFKTRVEVAVEQQATPDMDKYVKDFFEREAQRSVSFITPGVDAIPFDVIFIHICSLSWDDVRTVGLEQHPLWHRFDILLTRFNSAASYSGPAAIHLLRATCGQQAHDKMYFATPDKCYLMAGLENSGFKSELAMNHNGVFDDFLQQIQRHGRMTAPLMPQNGLDIAQYAFDKSPIYDDYSTLDRWLKNRQNSDSARVALFYSTVSLHDGNHLPGMGGVPNTLDTYKQRLTIFLDEMERFMQSLDESGRRAVVVMVPEHGAALRGDKRQISGLREIPTPAITLVPVGIKVIGGHVQREGDTVKVDQPSSYQEMAQIVARFLENSPFAGAIFKPSDYVANLSTTPFVSQNEKATVIEYDHRYFYNNSLDGWIDYSQFSLLETVHADVGP